MIPDSYFVQDLEIQPKCLNCKYSVVPRGTFSLVCGFQEKIDEDTLIDLAHFEWMKSQSSYKSFDDAAYRDKWISKRSVDKDGLCEEYTRNYFD